MRRDESDVRKAAEAWIAEHGAAAEERAAKRLQACMASEDVKEAGFWLAVLHEIHARQNETKIGS